MSSVHREIMAHNRYQSVARQMMNAETARCVEESLRCAGDNDSFSPQALRKALAMYCKVSERNIATAENKSSILNAILAGISARSAVETGEREQNVKVTYVEPLSAHIEPISETVNATIPSLLHCRDKEIADLVPQQRTLLYIANPNPISGEVYSVSQLRRILDNTIAHDVIIDESLCEYCGVSAIALLKEYPSLLILRTLDEAFGLEETPCSYLVAHEARITNIMQGKRLPELPQRTRMTALAALNRIDVMHRSVETVCENRIYLTTLLRRLGVTQRTSPLHFILVEMNDIDPARDALERFGVTVCKVTDGEEIHSYFRIPIGNETYCRNIVAAFTRLPREYYLKRENRSVSECGQSTYASQSNERQATLSHIN